LYLRLEPISWRQEIRDYPTINVEGRYLVASCKAAADADLRLSNNAKLTDLTVELSILVGEQPLDAYDKPLERGIGEFRFHGEMPSRDDLPGMDPFLSGLFYLKPESYSALWDQVREGGYASCEITISVDPVKSEGFGRAWDVSQQLTISSVALNFTRKPIADKPVPQPAPRKWNFASWWNPEAAVEAELDAFATELLNRDVEKRRRNAWLRKIGFVSRIFVYACLFGALFIFRPEALSEGSITTRPLAQLTIGDITGSVLWVVIGLVLMYALFNPKRRPDFQEAWGYFGLVLVLGAVVLGAVFLYFRG